MIKLFNATENLPILHPRHVQIQHWMNGRDKRREAIKHDFTRLKSLEEGSEAYKNLAIIIETRINQMHQGDNANGYFKLVFTELDELKKAQRESQQESKGLQNDHQLLLEQNRNLQEVHKELMEEHRDLMDDHKLLMADLKRRQEDQMLILVAQIAYTLRTGFLLFSHESLERNDIPRSH